MYICSIGLQRRGQFGSIRVTDENDSKMCSAAASKYVSQNVTANPPPAFNVPVAAVQYLNADGLAGGRDDRVTRSTVVKRQSSALPLQTVVLTFSVLMCIFSCLLTVTLSYKWHMDTNRQIDRLVDTVQTRVQTVLHDLNTLTEIVRDELVSKRLNTVPPSKGNGGGDGGNIKDYEDDDEDDENRFMGRELLANGWPTKSSSSYRSNEQSNTSEDRRRRRRRRRRAAEIGPIKIKNELNGSNNPKSDVELIEEEKNEENTVRTYNRRKPKKMGVGKRKPVDEQETHEDEETYEDAKDGTEIAAAHFTSDSTKYNTKTHMHYHGNGRLKHPDGDYRDWSQKLWDINLTNANPNQNNFQMKNGRVEVIKPGLYFVYAQIFYSDTHDINGYYIMQNDEQIFGCTTTRHQNNQSDSCYTGGLMNLNSKDIISIKGLDEERYIILDPVKSFFGLFKVSKDHRK